MGRIPHTKHEAEARLLRAGDGCAHESRPYVQEERGRHSGEAGRRGDEGQAVGGNARDETGAFHVRLRSQHHRLRAAGGLGVAGGGVQRQL